jgi:hypothetical protein
MSRLQEKITEVVGPARDISTAMIPTSKQFSEYFWRTLYAPTHNYKQQLGPQLV